MASNKSSDPGFGHQPWWCMWDLVFIVSFWNNELFMGCLKLLLAWHGERDECSRVKGWCHKPKNAKRQEKGRDAPELHSTASVLMQICHQFSCHGWPWVASDAAMNKWRFAGSQLLHWPPPLPRIKRSVWEKSGNATIRLQRPGYIVTPAFWGVKMEANVRES